MADPQRAIELRNAAYKVHYRNAMEKLSEAIDDIPPGLPVDKSGLQRVVEQLAVSNVWQIESSLVALPPMTLAGCDHAIQTLLRAQSMLIAHRRPLDKWKRAVPGLLRQTADALEAIIEAKKTMEEAYKLLG